MPPLFGITGSLQSHSLPSSRLAMRPQRARRLFSGSFQPTRRMDMTLAEGHCMRPQFNCTLWLWFDRGGIYVMANLRGGSEFGTEWHLNGNLTRASCVREGSFEHPIPFLAVSSRTGLDFHRFCPPQAPRHSSARRCSPHPPGRTRIPPRPGKPSEIRTSSFENNPCVARGGGQLATVPRGTPPTHQP